MLREHEIETSMGYSKNNSFMNDESMGNTNLVQEVPVMVEAGSG